MPITKVCMYLGTRTLSAGLHKSTWLSIFIFFNHQPFFLVRIERTRQPMGCETPTAGGAGKITLLYVG